MRTSVFTKLSVALSSILIAAGGCLERTETITVDLDQSVEFFVQFESDSKNEIHAGDAVPEIGSGWEFDERTIVNKDGKQRHQLWARKHVARGQPLPSTFARPGDTDRDLYLQFPTTLKLEIKNGSRYYHFARTYEPRTWAQYTIFEEEAKKRVESIEDQRDESGELTDAQQRAIVEAHASAVIKRFDQFSREAFLNATHEGPQDAWLIMHEALESFRTNLDYMALMEEVKSIESSEDGERFDELMRDFEEAVLNTLDSALRRSGYSQIASGFRREYARVMKAYEISKDLNDDSFTIRLKMPGQIVATNAQRREKDVLVWQFGGKMLHDRRIEILATSRVSNR